MIHLKQKYILWILKCYKSDHDEIDWRIRCYNESTLNNIDHDRSNRYRVPAPG